MTRQTRATIGTALRAWLKDKKKKLDRGVIRLSAYNALKSQVNTLETLIGHRKITDLTNYDLECFFNEELRDVEMPNGSKGYKDGSISNLHNTLKQTFDMLERQGKLKINPFTLRVKLDKLHDRKPILPYSIDEIKAVMSLADGRGIVEAFYFGCREGLRPCELFGLTQNNVSLAAMLSSILIDKCIVLGRVNMPKTEKSRRRITITQASADILRFMLKKEPQPTEFMLKGETHHERFVFFNPETNRHWQSSQEYYKSLKYFFDRAGVQFRGIHPIRHTYATTAIDSGLEIQAVADHMGHSSTDTTMKHYRYIKDAVLGRKTIGFREEHDPFKGIATYSANNDLKIAA